MESYPTPLDIRLLPGIYNIDFNTFAGSIGATPDGRKGGEMICEHYSPTPGNARNGPTTVIQSAAKANLRRGCASSPLYLVLPRGLGSVDAGLISQMVKSCGEAGLPVVSISIYDRSVLEDALLHPEKHKDLVVRVWGFNGRFIDLDEGMKQHVMLEMIALVKEQIVWHKRSTTFSNVANTSLWKPRLRISFQICSMGFISGV